MTGQGLHQPRKPEHINGFRIGDRVITPLGRVAVITGFRQDGYIDGKYENQHPVLAAVILQPQLLRRVQ